MKIAYYIYWLDGFESGVIKKISAQISYWKQQGNKVKLFVLTKKNSNFEKDYNTKSHLLKFDIELITFNNRLDQFINSHKVYSKINAYNPDLIYMRESKFSFGILQLNKKFSTIVEINSIQSNEENKNSISYKYNKITQNLKFKYIKAFIAVTNEIAHDTSLMKFAVPKYIIGNAIDLSSIKTASNRKSDKNINLVFIGTYGQKWHGIDKIIELAKFKKEWQFYFIGITNKNNKVSNIKYYGTLSRDEYEKIFNISDIAIGTLALYRKSMEEACPLKTREYLAYGLPVIIGYNDVDFPNDYDFICKLENKDWKIENNINKIEDFVHKWKGIRVSRDNVQHIDVEHKEELRLSIFKKTLNAK